MGEDDPDVTFGLWLRRWRQACDLSRPELARRVGCGQAMIKQMERDVSRPGAELAVRLAEELGAPLEERGRILDFARRQVGPPLLPLPNLAVAMAAQTPMPGNVTLPLTRLVGRDDELAALIKRLTRRTTRLVTLTGLTGIGKTHLARTAALAVQFRFVQGVWFVELAGVTDPTAMARTIADALGVADFGARPIESQVAIELAKGAMLLVLDGLEPAPPIAAVVRRLLATASRLTVLVTSARPLGLPGEAVVPLPPLSVPRADPALPPDELQRVPAVALFMERARTAMPEITVTEATAPPITAVCRRLAGHPLAIEQAAARLGTLSLDQLPASLAGDLDVGVTATTPPSRDHPGLRAIVDGAWDTLTDARQAVLARLAVFPAGFGHVAAEEVAGATPDDLTSLISAGLLSRETDDRFTVHELVRRSAERRLARSGERLSVARGYATYYVQLVEEAAPSLPSIERDPWLRRLAAERVHLQTAISWGLDHDPALALRLAAALPWYWYFRGALGEGRSWLERVLAAVRPGVTTAHARAQAGAGTLAWAQGDHSAARGWLEPAVHGLRMQATAPMLVHALAILALTAHDQGDHQVAVTWAAESTAAGRAIADPWSLALALTTEGAARLGAGDLQGARAALTESLAIWTKLGESWGVAMALLNRGRVAFVMGEHDAAVIYLEDGLDRLRSARDRRFTGAALLLLGEIARQRGDLPLARARLAAGLLAYRAVGAEWGVGLCLEALAATLVAAGRPDRAARLLGAAAGVRAPGAAGRSPTQAAAVEQLVAILRRALSEEVFAAHWEDGRLLTPEQAVAEVAAAAGTGATPPYEPERAAVMN